MSVWYNTIVTSNPQSSYRFSEGEGDRVLDIFGGHHLTRIAGPSEWGTRGIPSLDHSGGLHMTSEGERFEAPTSSPASIAPVMTCHFQIEYEGLGETVAPQKQIILGNLDAVAGTGWQAQVSATNQHLEIVVGKGAGVVQTIDSGVDLSVYTKSTFTLILNSRGVYLYRQDAFGYIELPLLPSDPDFGYVPSASDDPFYVGAATSASTTSFNGTLDEVYLWSRELSQAEITEMHVALYTDVDGSRYREWLPRHVQDDEDVVGLMDAEAREITRYDAAWQSLLDELFPQTATWALGRFEREAGFPVEPYGESLETRREAVVSFTQAKDAATGEDFHAALASITPSYSIYTDFTTSTLYVTLGIAPDDYMEARVETILKTITPAHLTYNIQYDAFIAGIATAGDTI